MPVVSVMCNARLGMSCNDLITDIAVCAVHSEGEVV